MLIYTISLCAVVAVTFLIQLQAYSHSHNIGLSKDLYETNELPLENVF